MSVQRCCVTGFQWDGTTSGRISKIGDVDTYIAGDNPDSAVLIVPDLFGWAFANIRLLADHYAKEANVTVYVPDFFQGDSLPLDLMLEGKYDEVDLAGFLAPERNGREAREDLVLRVAKQLREKHSTSLGAVGFCYGAWACFCLGSSEHRPAPLVDYIAVGHPSMVTKEDINALGVPLMVLAPEHDFAYTKELKMHTFETMIERQLRFDYRHFPGVEHACMVRGDARKEGERQALEAGKNAVVYWIGTFSQKI